MIISVPSDPGLRRIVLPSIIRISDAGLKTLSGSRKHQLKFDFDLSRRANIYAGPGDHRGINHSDPAVF